MRDETMESYSVHHAEFYVRDGENFTRELTNKFRFSNSAKRVSKSHIQWVLCSGQAKFLITQPKCTNTKNERSVDQDDEPFISNAYHFALDPCATGKLVKSRNTCSNVALKVKDVTACVQRVCRAGGTVLKPPRTISDDNGSVEVATIKSCVGNVIHTLINDSNYKGCFLPGFETVESQINKQGNPLVTHIDHVTFACGIGTSASVLKWYEDNLGMNRFMINRYNIICIAMSRFSNWYYS